MTRIVIAADDRYMSYAKCTLAQLANHSPSRGVVLLTPQEVQAPLLDDLRRCSDRLALDLQVVAVPAVEELAARGRVRSRGHVSTFTYSKLFISEVLSDSEVVYLDVDTLIRENFDPVLDFKLHHPIAAVRELGSNGVGIFGSTRVPYFNAGVLKMSLERLRAERFTEAATEYLRDNPRLQFQDQDVLNWFFHDRHDVLPHAFNVFDSYSETKLPAWKMLHDPAIVHFVGPNKPWTSSANSEFAREWRAIHATVLTMNEEEEKQYVAAERRTWESRVHGAIVTIRFSPLGQQIRSRLSVSTKDRMNRAILRVLPRRSLLKHEVLVGMNDVPAGASESHIEVVDASYSSDAVGEADGGANSAPTTPATMPISSSSGSKDELAGDVSLGEHLVLVCSMPRSGTNALNSMFRNILREVHIEGEMFFGHLSEIATAKLQERFPWIADANLAVRGSLPKAERDQAADRFRGKMSPAALEVTRELLRGREGITVVKVFPGHLDDTDLQTLMRELRPRVVILKRQMLFSFASFLKATETHSWFREDNTNNALTMNDEDARSYIRRADQWFDLVEGLIQIEGLAHLQVSYGDLFEGSNPYPLFREFLWDAKFRSTAVKSGNVTANTVRQDRRTDRSVGALAEQLTHLDAATALDLLRLPGSFQRSVAGGEGG